jgi:hypothetical protein
VISIAMEKNKEALHIEEVPITPRSRSVVDSTDDATKKPEAQPGFSNFIVSIILCGHEQN